MTRDRSETLVVITKAIGLSWSTVNEIMVLRAKKGFLAHNEIGQRLARFDRLQSGTAKEMSSAAPSSRAGKFMLPT